MNFISICSGIEAASVAFGQLGWKAIAFSEIEPFPCAVLAHHYPGTPNMGDMSKFRDWPEELFVQADAIVGGPPCQAFSIAGLRNGLNDDRGNLTLTYAELINHADAIRFIHGKPPVVVLYENVPGLLSDKTGAYGCFLAALAGESCPLEPAGGRWTDAGYVLGPKRAIAWRVLDAQHFQLAQRRRRVFVVASARAGFDPAAVLFEFDGVRRDSAPSRETWQGAAGILANRIGAEGCPGIITMASGQGDAAIDCDLGPTLTCNHEAPLAAYSATGRTIQICPTIVRRQPGTDAETADSNVVMPNMQVRRLTPIECERLQGFPDGYSAIPWRKKPASECPDGPRYKALGNSWAVPVVRWIGERISNAIGDAA